MIKRISKFCFICFLLLAATFIGASNFSPAVNALEEKKPSKQDFYNFEKAVISLNKTSPESESKILPLSSLKQDESGQLTVTTELNEQLEKTNSYYVATSNGVKVYKNFSLKRLIVSGKLDKTLGAKVVSFGDLHILSFDSEEQTESAYKELIKDSSLSVTIDKHTSVSGYFDNIYTYDNYKNIGAKALNIGGYRKYLSDNNITKEVVVAVLDTGINTSHEMFEGRLLTEDGKIKGYSYYQSRYNYSYSNLAFDEDDTNKYSFEDDDGHGSHVAGIICSLTPSNVKILPIKIGDGSHDNSSTSVTILTAHLRVLYVYSEMYNVVCTNLSFEGGGKRDEEQRDLFNEQCYKPLREQNILSITAAGNDSTENNMSDLEAIVVSSLKLDGENYMFDNSYSNYGSFIDISAPGTGIESAWIGDTNGQATDVYKTTDGTSMASPQIAATVALLYLDPKYETSNANEIEQRLYDLSVDLGRPGKDIYHGYGMANLAFFEVEEAGTLTFYKDSVEIEDFCDYENFTTPFSLSITCSDPSFFIVYTLNTAIPTINNITFYAQPIDVNKITFVYAMGIKRVNGEVVKRTELYNLSFFPADTPVEDCFEIDENGIITKYTGKFTNLEIPQVIKGIEAKGFHPHLFKGCNFERVTIPSSIKSISGWAFTKCENLKYLYAPKVTHIYKSAFSYCNSLTYVDTIEPVEDTDGCYLPSAQSLVGYTFYNCNKLKKACFSGIIFDEDNEGYHFARCTSLTAIRFESIDRVPQYCYYMCSKLTGVLKLTNINVIDQGAFAGCKLTGFEVLGTDTDLYTDGLALYQESTLVSFASGRSDVNYSILPSVTINETKHTVTTIGAHALSYSSFDTLTIPSTITTINRFAVSESKLNTLYFKANNCTSSGYWDEANLGRFAVFPDYIQTLEIGSGVNIVPERLFQSVNFENLIINSYSTQFGTACFYRIDTPILKTLKLEFAQSMSPSYRKMLEEESCLFMNEGVETIYAKKEIDLMLTPFITKYIYKYQLQRDGYYIYSMNSLGGNTITATAGENGSISNEGETYVDELTIITYKFFPDVGYQVKEILVDNVALTGSVFENAVKNGYTFTNVVKDRTISVTFTTLKNVEYTVKHWKESLTAVGATEFSGKYYTLSQEYVLTGETNKNTAAVILSYSGFTSPKITQQLIKGDGSTVVDILYTRNLYTVSLLTSQGVESVSGGGTYLFEQEVSISAIITRGYSFDRWQSSTNDFSNITTLNHTFTMPAFSVTLTAKTSLDQFVVKFFSEDGSTVLDTQTVNAYGSVSYSKGTPTKPDTTYYTYIFDKWVTEVNGNEEAVLTGIVKHINVYAKFKGEAKKYVVRFHDSDGTIIKVNNSDSQLVEYGSKPRVPDTITKSASNITKFVLTDWTLSDGSLVNNFEIICDKDFYALYKEYSIVTLSEKTASVTAKDGRALILLADLKTVGSRNLEIVFDNNVVTILNNELSKLTSKNSDVALSLSTEPFDLSGNIKEKINDLYYFNFRVVCNDTKLDNIYYSMQSTLSAFDGELKVWGYNQTSQALVDAQDVTHINQMLNFKANTSNAYLAGQEKTSPLGTILLIICGAGVVATPTTIIIIKLLKRPRRGLLR